MADLDDIHDGKDFALGTPAKNEPFFLKGAGAYDWGMQNRLARIFRPDTGRTVMLAFDHGYFQGPTTGLERVDVARHDRLQGENNLRCHHDGIDALLRLGAVRLHAAHRSAKLIHRGERGSRRETHIAHGHAGKRVQAEYGFRLGIVEDAFTHHQVCAAFFTLRRPFFRRLKNKSQCSLDFLFSFNNISC